MTEETKTLAESQGAEAINAVAIAAEAAQKANASQIEAALESAMERFFSRGVQEKRFIDVGRIPFICDDLSGIHTQIGDQGNDIRWIKWLVMGMAGGIGLVAITLLTR